MTSRNSPGRRAWAKRSPETVDWIMVGLCVLIWLVLLGMSVAAVVALVNLGRGFHEPTSNSHTGLLYIIIGVSALVILAAIPVLLRARQAVPTRLAPRPADFAQRPGAAPPARPGPRTIRAGGTPLIGPDGDAADRVLLRGTTELTSAIGTALIGVAVATYLMAVGKDTGAWVAYGVAGFVTVAMPVIPWRYARQLQALPE